MESQEPRFVVVVVESETEEVRVSGALDTMSVLAALPRNPEECEAAREWVRNAGVDPETGLECAMSAWKEDDGWHTEAEEGPRELHMFAGDVTVVRAL